MATADEYQEAFIESCRSYWATRDRQALTGLGEGLAGAVRGGKHFASLEDLVASVFIECGYTARNLIRSRSANLPGFYRATKTWDLLVVDGDILVAALELKSLGARSASNNFNNRTEEAIGNATDLWLVHDRLGGLGPLRPWCGFMFLMEDAPETRHSVREMPSRWDASPEFEASNYLERGAILSARMQDEGLYNAVCYVTSTNDPNQLPHEPFMELSWLTFVDAIRARVAEVEHWKASGRA